MPDSASKKRWDKQNVLFVTVKLFRQVSDRQNDQAIIDYLQGESRGTIIKQALCEYMANHPKETKGE